MSQGTCAWPRLRLGARPDREGTTFRVCGRQDADVRLRLTSGRHAGRTVAMQAAEAGVLEARVDAVGDGDHYQYLVGEDGPVPDPCSRYQPDGVHGPSEVVDPHRFTWTDASWRRPRSLQAIYELHVGTFSTSGTFAGVADRLPMLAALGITAVELMPVADFAGDRSWGYDGVALYAPARCYGRPDDLRRLVDVAHGLGLAVLLDVVYNHLGPDGAYLPRFWPQYFTDAHSSPWGAGVNLDGPGSDVVRGLIADNATSWIEEFHLDGLRLDATHALEDRSATHTVQELANAVHALDPEHPPLVMAEDERNLSIMVRQPAAGGWGLDAVWADDFHHQMRRLLAGDRDGYFADFSGTTADLARTIRQGWFFTGQPCGYLGRRRGTATDGIPLDRFVICIQNHDQVGNRALGDRLSDVIEAAAYRAASALLLLAPETPLLFMGQEWAASTPFQYFTDHQPTLGRLVTDGRRNEFRRFAAFADPAARDRIPDPQAESTFLRCVLDWSERDREPHASLVRLYTRLLELRATLLAPGAPDDALHVDALDGSTVVLRRGARPGQPMLLAVVRLRGRGRVDLSNLVKVSTGQGRASCVLTTEDRPFASDATPPALRLGGPQPAVEFARPGAVVLALGAARQGVRS